MLLIVCMVLTGCSRRDPEVEKGQAANETLAKMSSCAPQDKAESKLKLAIAEVTNQPSETLVRIVAYSIDEAVDFDLPVYFLSRGRWTINEQGRAYLLDERCREYRLKDRRSSSGPAIPRDGRIRLKPGQAYEATLSFPRLPDQTQIGILIYGERVMPFSLVGKAK